MSIWDIYKVINSEVINNGIWIKSKDFFASKNFELKNENGQLLSFNALFITFRLSIREIQFIPNQSQWH